MFELRERALTLAQDAEAKDGISDPASVVDRARIYLDFLQGTRDAEIIDAARMLSEKINSST